MIFAGVLGKQLPAGIDQGSRSSPALRATGTAQLADLLAGMDVVPGQRHRLRRAGHVLLLVLALYVVGRRCSAGCRATCSTASCSAPCRGLRADVEDKLNRLPLRYFDRQPRGELLSRVTNDIDNVAQSLQQTHEPAADLAAHGGRRARHDVRRSRRCWR